MLDQARKTETGRGTVAGYLALYLSEGAIRLSPNLLNQLGAPPVGFQDMAFRSRLIAFFDRQALLPESKEDVTRMQVETALRAERDGQNDEEARLFAQRVAAILKREPDIEGVLEAGIARAFHEAH